MTATRRLRCDDTVQVVCANKLTHTHVPTCTHQGPRSKIIAPTHVNDIWGNGPYAHGWLERLNRLGGPKFTMISLRDRTTALQARTRLGRFLLHFGMCAKYHAQRIEIHHNAPLSQIKNKMVRSGEIGEIREKIESERD